MNNQMKADLMLLLVVAAWGFSFLFVDLSVAALGTFTVNAYRFPIAFAVVAALAIAMGRFKNFSRATVLASVILGSILASMFVAMTFAFTYTTLPNVSFLCGLTVIFTPILSAILTRQALGKKIFLVSLMCLAGIALLTLTDSFSINYENLKGDFLAIYVAFGYAIHLIITEKAVNRPDVDAFQMGILQLGVTGLISIILAFAFEGGLKTPPDAKVWGMLLFLAVFCTGMAFVIQTVAQKYTTASHVGVICCLETVFAGIVAYAFGTSEPTIKAIAGAILIVAAIFIMEIDFGKLLRGKTRE